MFMGYVARQSHIGEFQAALCRTQTLTNVPSWRDVKLPIFLLSGCLFVC